jgi:hypothetical protein
VFVRPQADLDAFVPAGSAGAALAEAKELRRWAR